MGNNFINSELKRKYDKYALFIENKDSVSIEYLASAVGISPKAATAELQAMIVLGYFGKDAYIDYYTKSLVIHPKTARSAGNTGNAESRKASSGYTRTTQRRTSSSSFTAADLEKTVKAAASAAADIAGSLKNSFSSINRKPPVKKPLISEKPFVKKGKLGFLAVNGGIFSLGAAAMLTEVPYDPSALIGVAFCAFIGAFSFIRRHKLAKINSHFLAYRTIIGDKAYISIKNLAKSAGVDAETVKKDLQNIIEKGLMGKKAYIDHGSDCLILDPSQYNYSFEDVTFDEPEEEPAEVENADVAKEAENQYYEIIKEIRELNDAITDPDVSERIYKIEEITSKIFQIVEDKPEKVPEIRSFMSYYLPTTLKLLRSYAMLERQGVNGDNINATKENIEKVLDSIVKGFSQQLDQLFKSEYLDISTDIDVLESMMKKDGLSDDGMFQVQRQ